jgi:hypothetical protein
LAAIPLPARVNLRIGVVVPVELVVTVMAGDVTGDVMEQVGTATADQVLDAVYGVRVMTIKSPTTNAV